MIILQSNHSSFGLQFQVSNFRLQNKLALHGSFGHMFTPFFYPLFNWSPTYYFNAKLGLLARINKWLIRKRLMYWNSLGKLRSDLEELAIIYGLFTCFIAGVYRFLAVVATFFTLFGLPLAIYEIMKIKTADESAKEATTKTGRQIQTKQVLTKLPDLEGAIRQIRESVHSKQFKEAHEHVIFLKLEIMELKDMHLFSDNRKQTDIGKYVNNLGLMESELFEKVNDPTYKIEQSYFGTPLSKIEEFLRKAKSAEKHRFGEDDEK